MVQFTPIIERRKRQRRKGERRKNPNARWASKERRHGGDRRADL